MQKVTGGDLRAGSAGNSEVNSGRNLNNQLEFTRHYDVQCANHEHEELLSPRYEKHARYHSRCRWCAWPWMRIIVPRSHDSGHTIPHLSAKGSLVQGSPLALSIRTSENAEERQLPASMTTYIFDKTAVRSKFTSGAESYSLYRVGRSTYFNHQEPSKDMY